jgi:hypothetical protein
MIKKFKIGNLNVKLGFKHYWQSHVIQYMDFREFHLGLKYKKTVSIGSDKKGRDMFDDDNHVTTHVFGLNLIWVKIWMSFTMGDIMIFGDR